LIYLISIKVLCASIKCLLVAGLALVVVRLVGSSASVQVWIASLVWRALGGGALVVHPEA